MIRKAIEKIEEMVKTEHIVIAGQDYTTKKAYKIQHDPTPQPDVLSISTLSGVVDYCTSKIDSALQHVIHIGSYKVVRVYGEYEEAFGRRKQYLSSHVDDFGFSFERYYDQESFIINLLTQFEENQTLKDILKIVSNIKTESKSEYVDDGMSQKVVVQESIARVAEVKLPNPVDLIPKRSFPEINSVNSPFILRMKKSSEGPTFALYEAGFATWEVRIKEQIRLYLLGLLPEGMVIIA